MNNEIPLLSELIDAYDRGEITKDGVYICYPTDQHRESKSYWWFPLQEIKCHSIARKVAAEQLNKILWNNGQ